MINFRKILFCLSLLLMLTVLCDSVEAARKPAVKKSSGIDISRIKPPAGYKPEAPRELKADATDWTVELTWKDTSDLFFKHYAVYVEADGDDESDEDKVKLEKVAETKEPLFREEGLEPDSDYTYWIATVASNGAESKPVAIDFSTQPMTRPPLEIDVLEMKDIFTNNYKLYESEGIGKIRIRNNTSEQISRLKLSFTVRSYMDYPTELELRNIEPHESRVINLKAVLTNRVLDILEDTPLQTELNLSYYFNGQLRTYTTSRTVMMHEKHRMIWKDPDMAAVFVTPKDTPVLDLSRSIVTQIGDSSSPLVLAGAIFETLGKLGITYIRDPSNPYQISDGKVNTVDYVQYPVETLKRKSGDCKGMVVLFSSLLESLGIRTIMLDYPGHMFLMFAVTKGTSVPKGELAGLLFPYDGELWAPVELTLVGLPFLQAWEKGSRQFIEWTSKKGLGMMDVRSAWKRYKPATLPSQIWQTPVVTRQELESRFGDELSLLRRLTVQANAPALFEALRANPRNLNSLLQIGIRFGEAGDTTEASKYLNQAAQLQPRSAEIINNLANLRMLEGNHEQALPLYQRAAELDPADPHILVNIARCNLQLGQRDAAKNIFKRALAMRPDIIERYRRLAVELAH